MRRWLPWIVVPPVLGLSAWAFAVWPVGATIGPSIYIDVTREGFEQIEALVRPFIPESLPLAGVDTVQGGQFGSDFLGADYEFGVQNVTIFPSLENLVITPKQGDLIYPDATPPQTVRFMDELAVDLDLDVSVGSAADPIYAYVDVDVGLLFFEFGLIDEECYFWLEDKPVTVDTRIFLGADRSVDPRTFGQVVRDADGFIDPAVYVGRTPVHDELAAFRDMRRFEWTLGVSTIDDLQRDCSGFADFLFDAAGFFGIDPIEILVASFTPTIDEEVDAAIADIEPQIDEALSALAIEESLDLLGQPLNIAVKPREWFLDGRGMRMQLDGSFDPGEFAHPCVVGNDPGTSKQTIPSTDPRYPVLREPVEGAIRHFGASVNDDFLNQALYGIYRQGLLCQSIQGDSAPVDLPIPLDSDLFNLLAGGQFAEFFPTKAPIAFETRPQAPPELFIGSTQYTGAVTMEDFGVDLYAELDGRMTRFAGYDLDLAIGVDVGFGPRDGFGEGQIGVLPRFTTDDVQATIVYNDLKPDASQQLESGFAAVLELVVEPLVGGLLEDFTFDLPTFAGVGITDAYLLPTGPIDDFLGVFGDIGTVDYGDPAGGCDALGLDPDAIAGCAGGCSSGGAPRGAGLVLLLGVAAARRRRR